MLNMQILELSQQEIEWLQRNDHLDKWSSPTDSKCWVLYSVDLLRCVPCFARCGKGPIPTVPPSHPDGQALAESLKSNGSLWKLVLKNNKIGDLGAEASAAECLPAGAGG